MSLKLVEDQIVDDKPSLLPPACLGGAVLEVAADGRALVASPHLPQDSRQAHVLVPGEGSDPLVRRNLGHWGKGTCECCIRQNEC